MFISLANDKEARSIRGVYGDHVGYEDLPSIIKSTTPRVTLRWRQVGLHAEVVPAALHRST
jgi:hypothetical protein